MNPIRAKLLIVDASDSMRNQLRQQMHDLGFVRIDEAPDAVAALELVQNNHYDLVLCEWDHARYSGIDLVRSVRHAPVGRDTPVLLISDDGSARRTVEALEAGANGLLARPFSDVRLGDKVTRIIALLAPPSDLVRMIRNERVHGDDTWLPTR